ncbi:hypothetical protein D3C87_1804220 [compost metagenome]
MITHHQSEPVAIAHAARDQSRRQLVSISPQVGIGPDLVQTTGATLKGDYIEVRIPFSAHGDEIRQNRFVKFSHL